MLSFLIGLVLTLLTLVLLVPSLVFIGECMLAMLHGSDDLPLPHVKKPLRRAVLVPALCDPRSLAETLRSIRPELSRDDRCLVLVDPTDRASAEVARAEGARVVACSKPGGKGGALAQGLRELESDPPDVVLFVDADVELSERSIDALSRLAFATKRPVQADSLAVPEKGSAIADLCVLSCLVQQRVRPRGLRLLDLPCQLTGACMAFGWDVIQKLPPLASQLGDPRRMGLELARLGHAPLYTGHAHAYGTLPASLAHAQKQRARIEHAQLNAILDAAPRMLRAGFEEKRVELIALGLDLLVPPITLLVWLLVGAWVLTVLGASFTSYLWPAAIVTLCLFGVGATGLLTWWSAGQGVLPAKYLVAIPLYMLWKVPIYVAYVAERAWRRA